MHAEYGNGYKKIVGWGEGGAEEGEAGGVLTVRKGTDQKGTATIVHC